MLTGFANNPAKGASVAVMNLCGPRKSSRPSDQRPLRPLSVKPRAAGEAAYGVISNTEPKVVLPSPWVVP